MHAVMHEYIGVIMWKIVAFESSNIGCVISLEKELLKILRLKFERDQTANPTLGGFLASQFAFY